MAIDFGSMTNDETKQAFAELLTYLSNDEIVEIVKRELDPKDVREIAESLTHED